MLTFLQEEWGKIERVVDGTMHKRGADDFMVALRTGRLGLSPFSNMTPAAILMPQIIDHVPRIRESVIRDEYKSTGTDGRPEPRPVVPGMHRKRTLEEMKELRDEAERERVGRYRGAYEMIDLKVVAYPDGTLEISWSGGACKLSGTRW